MTTEELANTYKEDLEESVENQDLDRVKRIILLMIDTSEKSIKAKVSDSLLQLVQALK